MLQQDGYQKNRSCYCVKSINRYMIDIRVNNWYQYNSHQPKDQKLPFVELILSMTSGSTDAPVN